MAKLLYISPTSLDGYLADETRSLDWSAPDEEFLAYITDLLRPIGTYLYGRKMYQTMAVWETPEAIPGLTPAMSEFASVWQAAGKVVYSKSLETVSTARTRIEREFDPQAIRDLKTQSPRDFTVGGPTLAAHAIRAGLIDEYHLFVVPRMIGGGNRILPPDVDVKLDLLDERRFASGWLYLRYHPRA